jgi:hypothetical protein
MSSGAGATGMVAGTLVASVSAVVTRPVATATLEGFQRL